MRSTVSANTQLCSMACGYSSATTQVLVTSGCIVSHLTGVQSVTSGCIPRGASVSHLTVQRNDTRHAARSITWTLNIGTGVRRTPSMPRGHWGCRPTRCIDISIGFPSHALSSTPTTTTGSGFRPTRCRLRLRLQPDRVSVPRVVVYAHGYNRIVVFRTTFPLLQPDRRFPYDLPISPRVFGAFNPTCTSSAVSIIRIQSFILFGFVSHLTLPEGPTNLATVGNPQFGPWVIAEIFPFFTIQPDSTSWRSNRRLTGWCGGTNAELLVPDPFSQSISGRSSVRLSQEMTR
jgi:hypothetical protein